MDSGVRGVDEPCGRGAGVGRASLAPAGDRRVARGVQSRGLVLRLASAIRPRRESPCALSGLLAPGGRRVVYGRESYDWERGNGYPAFGLSLSNAGDRVMLWQVSGSDTLLMDSYAYGSHEAAADRAIGRFPDGSGPWVLFDGLDPYTGSTPPAGNSCDPTPGSPNTCESTPASALTWGRLKTLYR